MAGTWAIAQIPLDGAELRLHGGWWAKAITIWVNGDVFCIGDLFDQQVTLPLTAAAVIGEVWQMEVLLQSPNHMEGALQALQVWCRFPQLPVDPDTLGTELAVVAAYAPLLDEVALGWVAQAIARLPDPEEPRWWEHLSAVREPLVALQPFFEHRQGILVGNTHLDVAWLWAIAETKLVWQRTCESMVHLKNQHPQLTFNQTTALFYQWLEQDHPDLFAKVRQAVAEGWWELTGGMWVEPDGNLPSGESLVRQILHGKQYFWQQFQQNVAIASLPDTFGFHGQMPQIFQQSGFTAFLTQKLSWNDTHPFPYQLFWWQGVDGSRILTYCTNGIGAGLAPEAIAQHLSQLEQKHQFRTGLWLYGVGDHGGGPTAAMLQDAQPWFASQRLCPNLRHGTIGEFFYQLSAFEDLTRLPVWEGELYLEFHRGTYTSRADQKLANRRLEGLLTQTEQWRSLFQILHHRPYPDLTEAWCGLLVNQFHDILPGTAITQVFEDANRTWAAVESQAQQSLGEVLPPYRPGTTSGVILNPLPYPRQTVVELSGVAAANYPSVLIDGIPQATQPTPNGLLFLVNDPQGCGVHSFTLSEHPVAHAQDSELVLHRRQRTWELENPYLVVSLSPETGDIQQIFDKRSGRSLLRDAATVQFFTDQGQYWDAWNIDPAFAEHPLPAPTLHRLECLTLGPRRGAITIERQFQSSRWQQTLILEAHSPLITIANRVDWQESHVLAKAAFPVCWHAATATYEIPFGHIERPTTEPAQFEVPSQFWADSSDGTIGLSLLNDCKYGYDIQPDQLRLTLLRSPEFPCPQSDRGVHEFTYQILPHQGDWRQAQTLCHAHALNRPWHLTLTQPHLHTLHQWLHLSTPDVVLTCFKCAADGDGWILRCYEAHGQRNAPTFTFSAHLPPLQAVWECDLLEEPRHRITHATHHFTTPLRPLEIKTFRLQFFSSEDS
ncbi:MAG: alpha-mannosidase [Oscillatoriales cyanobacterium SM2_2_1]|nr:alpha-mannosidase [Oscillatoriales cyanobacterium SM2_2_1]